MALSGRYLDLTGLPALAPVALSGRYLDLTGLPALAPVATTGRYADLTGLPDLAAYVTGPQCVDAVAASGRFLAADGGQALGGDLDLAGHELRNVVTYPWGDHPVELLLRNDHPALAHVRYMDDVLLFGPNRRALWAAHRAVQELVEAAGLALKPQATRLAPTTEGVPFLGLRIFPGMVRLDRRGRVRFGRRVRRVARARATGRLSPVRAEAALASLFGHAAWAETLDSRRAMVRALWP